MSALLALIRKNLLDSRWLLLSLSSALFGLCWLTVYVAGRIEKMMAMGRTPGLMRGPRGLAMDAGSATIEAAIWDDPPYLLMISIWAIARGSVAVSGEMEKGTMDLVLSRPVPRFIYLLAQVKATTFGLLIIGAAMLGGHRVGLHYNTVAEPPSLGLMARPTVNFLLIGFAIYGYTLVLSAIDHVRWRPNLIASVATLGGFIAQVVANLPTMADYKWLEKFSIFKPYDPIELVTKGETLAFNAGLLGSIGLAGVVLGMILFSRRDIPAGSG